MSEAEVNTEAQAANAEPEMKMSADDLLKRVKELESTNSRLLEESKKRKSAAHDLKSKLEEIERARLEEDGRWKDLAEKRLEELNEKTTAYEALQKQMIFDKVKLAVSSEAQKAGCVHFDGLMKLGNASLLQYDEDSREVVGVKDFLEDARKSVPFLFASQRTAAINPAAPGMASDAKPKKLTPLEIARLPLDERIKYQVAAAKGEI